MSAPTTTAIGALPAPAEPETASEELQNDVARMRMGIELAAREAAKKHGDADSDPEIARRIAEDINRLVQIDTQTSSAGLGDPKLVEHMVRARAALAASRPARPDRASIRKDAETCRRRLSEIICGLDDGHQQLSQTCDELIVNADHVGLLAVGKLPPRLAGVPKPLVVVGTRLRDNLRTQEGNIEKLRSISGTLTNTRRVIEKLLLLVPELGEEETAAGAAAPAAVAAPAAPAAPAAVAAPAAPAAPAAAEAAI